MLDPLNLVSVLAARELVAPSRLAIGCEANHFITAEFFDREAAALQLAFDLRDGQLHNRADPYLDLTPQLSLAVEHENRAAAARAPKFETVRIISGGRRDDLHDLIERSVGPDALAIEIYALNANAAPIADDQSRRTLFAMWHELHIG
jgi:hypothetical protein